MRYVTQIEQLEQLEEAERVELEQLLERFSFRSNEYYLSLSTGMTRVIPYAG